MTGRMRSRLDCRAAMLMIDSRGCTDRGRGRGIRHDRIFLGQTESDLLSRVVEEGRYLGPKDVGWCRVWKNGTCRFEQPLPIDLIEHLLMLRGHG